MNQITIVFGLLLVSIFLNVTPSLTTTVTAAEPSTIPPDSNPYSFYWWYSPNPFHPDEYVPYDPDTYENPNNQKHDWIKDDRKDIRYCSNSGYWNGDKCIIEDEEEKAVYEDAVCDDPKDTKKYAKLCGGSSSEDKKDDKPKPISTTEQTVNNNDDTVASSLKSLQGKSFDEVVGKGNGNNNDDDSDNDSNDDNDNEKDNSHDDNDDNDSNDSNDGGGSDSGGDSSESDNKDSSDDN